MRKTFCGDHSSSQKLKIPNYLSNSLVYTVRDHSLSKKKKFDKMVTGQTWTSDFRQKITRVLLIKEIVVNGKKLYNQALYFYISKKPVKFEVNRLRNFRVTVVTTFCLDFKPQVLKYIRIFSQFIAPFGLLVFEDQ